MEKIKCPFCGEEIKADSKFCPNCGKKLEDYKAEENTIEESVDAYFSSASPRDTSWINRWKTRDILYKLTFALIFIACLIAHIYLVKQYNYFKHASHTPDEIVAAAVGSVFTGIGSALFGSFFLYTIMKFRITVQTVDGYNVMVASGMYNRLIIEGEVQYKSDNETGGFLSRRYAKDMHGVLPNNKKVWANVVSFFGQAEIGLGEGTNNH